MAREPRIYLFLEHAAQYVRDGACARERLPDLVEVLHGLLRIRLGLLKLHLCQALARRGMHSRQDKDRAGCGDDLDERDRDVAEGVGVTPSLSKLHDLVCGLVAAL